MKILLTGVAGFIGSNVCRFLLERNFEVIGIDNFDNFYDIEIKKQNILPFLSYPKFSFYELDIRTELDLPVKVDMVIHLAAKAGVLQSIGKSESFFETNFLGTKNVLEWMRKQACDKIIFSSSSSVYGDSNHVVTENSSTTFQLNPYASSKKESELLLFNYFSDFGINAVILRLFSVYGPNQRPDLAMYKFSNRIINGETIEIYGDGNSKRDYTHIEDVISGILSSIHFLNTHAKVYEIFNVGNGKPVSVLKMVNDLGELFHAKYQLAFLPQNEYEMQFTSADISKAGRMLNFVPKVTFETGIRLFFKWFNWHMTLREVKNDRRVKQYK